MVKKSESSEIFPTCKLRNYIAMMAGMLAEVSLRVLDKRQKTYYFTNSSIQKVRICAHLLNSKSHRMIRRLSDDTCTQCGLCYK